MIDLSKFADGAVMERFNIELKKVLENIADPNTDAKKARKITLTVTIKGDEKRDVLSSDIQVKTTLVPAKDISTKIIMDQDNKGEITGMELVSGAKGQMFLNTEGEVSDDVGNVVDFSKQSL